MTDDWTPWPGGECRVSGYFFRRYRARRPRADIAARDAEIARLNLACAILTLRCDKAREALTALTALTAAVPALESAVDFANHAVAEAADAWRGSLMHKQRAIAEERDTIQSALDTVRAAIAKEQQP